MKKKFFILCAIACGLAFSSCEKKDAANALSDSAKEITEEQHAEFCEADAIQLTADMDTTSLASGTSAKGFPCRVCNCSSYSGVYQGYFPPCYRCGHAYGMH